MRAFVMEGLTAYPPFNSYGYGIPSRRKGGKAWLEIQAGGEEEEEEVTAGAEMKLGGKWDEEEEEEEGEEGSLY